MYTGTLDPVSNRADFKFLREIIDDDTDEPIDISTASIVFQIRTQNDDPNPSSSYGTILLTATTANAKITVVDTGTFQVWFTETDMQTLCAGYYDVGCTLTVNGLTTQLMAAELPVVDGIVSA